MPTPAAPPTTPSLYDLIYNIGAGSDQADFVIRAGELANLMEDERRTKAMELLKQLQEIQAHSFSLVPALNAYAATGGGTMGSANFLAASQGRGQPSPYGDLAEQLMKGLGDYATGNLGKPPPGEEGPAPAPGPVDPNKPPDPAGPGGPPPGSPPGSTGSGMYADRSGTYPDWWSDRVYYNDGPTIRGLLSGVGFHDQSIMNNPQAFQDALRNVTHSGLPSSQWVGAAKKIGILNAQQEYDKLIAAGKSPQAALQALVARAGLNVSGPVMQRALRQGLHMDQNGLFKYRREVDSGQPAPALSHPGPEMNVPISFTSDSGGILGDVGNNGPLGSYYKPGGAGYYNPSDPQSRWYASGGRQTATARPAARTTSAAPRARTFNAKETAYLRAVAANQRR